MQCKFLDSYEAELDGATIQVWHCLKREPFVLGASEEVAMATCSSCRLSDYTRPPAELALEMGRRNRELVALDSIVAAVNASLDLHTVLNMGFEKVLEIRQVDSGWVSMPADGTFTMGSHRGVPRSFADAAHVRSSGEGLVGVFKRSYLEISLERTIMDLRRNGGRASILFLDVGDLKSVNDGRGHHAGDRLLQDLAGLRPAPPGQPAGPQWSC